MKSPLFLMLLLASCLAAPEVQAENADRNKPMNAEADALRYDDLKQTSVFTGNVVITKGTTIIRGDRVEVTQDPEGYQQAVVTVTPGKLAFYRKKREALNEFIEGEAERIEYDSRIDIVKFTTRAVLRRFTGATLADETTGSQIAYDNKTDVFTVDGGAQNRTATNPSGRIRAVLSPRAPASGVPVPRDPASGVPVPRAPASGAGSASGAASAAKAAPAPTSSPVLRSSPELGSDKK